MGRNDYLQNPSFLKNSLIDDLKKQRRLFPEIMPNGGS